jgi:peptidylprolyl isomerase
MFSCAICEINKNRNMRNILILIFVLNSVNYLFSQDASLIYKNTVNSTCTILTDNGSQGSGFFVAPNIIATNYHVVAGAASASCYLNNSDIEYQIEGYIGVDKSVDLILLKVSTLNKPAIKFASTPVSIGQKVYVLGSPRGLPATISDGIISGMRDFEGNKLLQMTASISPGSSGGPVLNSNSELIGISVSQLHDGQNINFAIPKSYLEILLNFKKEKTPMALSSLFGLQTTASGLQYAVLTKGNGTTHPTATSKVTVHYHGTTPDGTVFDSSVDRGETISFGLNQVIKGWTEAIQLMVVGDKYIFFFPTELAFGANPPQGGSGLIKANMPLVFEIELFKIETPEPGK